MNDDEHADDDLDGDPFEDGEARTPVHVVGRIIARSPMGALWCGFIDQCGSPGRAERGQAYVRAGAVVDLKVRPGCITAEVEGAVRLRPIVNVPLGREGYLSGPWTLPGAQGRFVLQFMLPRLNVLPAATELLGSCGCADRVPLCEHVLAALYGFGARLDAEPELLLLLRGGKAAALLPPPKGLVIAPLAQDRVELTGSLAALFNLNLRDDPLPTQPPPLEDSPVASHPDVAASQPAAPTGEASDETESHSADESRAATPLAEVRRDYLKFIGIRSRTIDIWIREGVLLPTDRFHVYRRTEEANRRIAAKLAR
mgnify:CR=1 FL=1